MTSKKEPKNTQPQVPAEVKPIEQAVTTTGRPSIPRGFGDEDVRDYLLPRVELLQALSPAVVDDNGKAGDLVNNITKEKLPSNIIMPVFLKKQFIRWVPRDEGGGIFYRTDDPQDPRVIQDTKWVDGAKPLCTQYLNFLCMVEGDEMPIVLSFHDTSYQAGRELLTSAKLTGLDMWKTKYELSSAKTTNNFGTFYKFKVKKLGPASPEYAALGEKVFNEFYSKDLKFTDDREDSSAYEQTDAKESEF